MRTSVSNRFVDFSTRFEGRVAWMYADVKGLITVGIGNLIDPRSAAVGLPFVDKVTGEAASPDAVGAEWDLLKSRKDELGRKGHRACEAITNLRLTDAAIDELVLAKVRSNETVLRSSFPDFDQYPADAQLGLHSMAWALGPAFAPGWPNFSAAVRALDFDGAADNCRMNEVGNPGLKPRNDADQLLFRNAAAVLRSGADPDVLHHPDSFVAESEPDPTQTDVDEDVDVSAEIEEIEEIEDIDVESVDGVIEPEPVPEPEPEPETETDDLADAATGGGR